MLAPEGANTLNTLRISVFKGCSLVIIRLVIRRTHLSLLRSHCTNRHITLYTIYRGVFPLVQYSVSISSKGLLAPVPTYVSPALALGVLYDAMLSPLPLLNRDHLLLSLLGKLPQVLVVLEMK